MARARAAGRERARPPGRTESVATRQLPTRRARGAWPWSGVLAARCARAGAVGSGASAQVRRWALRQTQSATGVRRGRWPARDAAVETAAHARRRRGRREGEVVGGHGRKTTRPRLGARPPPSSCCPRVRKRGDERGGGRRGGTGSAGTRRGGRDGRVRDALARRAAEAGAGLAGGERVGAGGGPRARRRLDRRRSRGLSARSGARGATGVTGVRTRAAATGRLAGARNARLACGGSRC